MKRLAATFRAGGYRSAAFVLEAPTLRAFFWRLVYSIDYAHGKRLAGNRPTPNQDVRQYRELERAVRTETDGQS